MLDLIAAVCALLGASSILLGAVSLLRMPDIYMRLSAATKAVSFGLALCLMSMALRFASLYVTIGALATMVFLFLTAPIAAHMISRAAYRAGIPMWRETTVDELAGADQRPPSGPA